jgi:hypothetical protein
VRTDRQRSRFARLRKQINILKFFATTRALVGHTRRDVHADYRISANSILQDLPALVR